MRRRLLAVPALLLALGLVLASGGIGYAGDRTPAPFTVTGHDPVEDAAREPGAVGRLLDSLLPALGLAHHHAPGRGTAPPSHHRGGTGHGPHRVPPRPWWPVAPRPRPTPAPRHARPAPPAAPAPRSPHPSGALPTARATGTPARAPRPPTPPRHTAPPAPPGHIGLPSPVAHLPGGGRGHVGVFVPGLGITVRCPFGLLRVRLLPGLTPDVCEVEVRTAACSPLLVIDFWGNHVVIGDPRQLAELRKLLGIAARTCHKPHPTPHPAP
ncbi:hypothetical protein POF43_025600, partial [Streptomyces sp. SL54]|nr:hypothetical protein [Streptantibioticus silvisoli]